MDFGLGGETSNILNPASQTIYIDVSHWMFFVILAIAILLIFIIRKIIKHYVLKSKYYDHIIYQIRLPKEKPEDKEKEITLQMLREEISHGESIFASIGGLRAQRGFKQWLFGRNDHYSFEIVAHKKIITFYAVAPREMGPYMEKQIQAHYPDAVMEEVGDYNIFTPKSALAAGYIKTIREYIFPLKTYNKFEVDPLNTLLNAMSKLDTDEGVVIQYIVRSAHGRWHLRGREIVQKAIRKNSLREALGKGVISKSLYFLGDIVKSAKPPSNPNDPLKPIKRLTAMEEEILKEIETKNSKAGLDANLRIIVSAKTKSKAISYLNNIISAMSQYNYYEYGNKLKGKITAFNRRKIINDYIYRHFDERKKILLNTEELASLYHLPLKDAETPNILWLTAKFAPAPANLPETGIIIGYNNYRGIKREVKIKRQDRRRHMYIVGKSGVGKSQFMANMAVQDILNGEGVCLLDPHGDLFEDILSRIPPERAEDVVIFSPSDLERPLGLNLLEFDPLYPEQKSFVINEMISIFDKLYDLKATGGPIFEQYMRNAMLLIMSSPETGSTLMEIPKVLADPDFRKKKLEKCGDPTVVDFWKKEAEKAGGDAALANIVPYITSKLTSFISNDMMRPIIGQQKSAFNLRYIMDNQKILLINLPKGIVGELNAYLLGMILVGKILMSALSRADMPNEKRKDFYLYIDEFQNFTTNSITQVLSEARKYGLNLTIAHQYIGQLVINNSTSIKDAVFGNVGTTVAFKVGSDDAEFLEKEFSPVFNKFDLINIQAYTAYLKLLIENSSARPFSLASPWPIAGIKRDDTSRKIKALSRLKYGQDKHIIEAEIRRRYKL